MLIILLIMILLLCRIDAVLCAFLEQKTAADCGAGGKGSACYGICITIT